MSDAPRRRRATDWAWVFLALFGSDGDRKETTDGSASDTGNGDANDRLRRSDP